MPTPKPWMTTVAGPVLPDLVMFWVGVSVYEVEYSVNAPMRMPERRPTQMHEKSFIAIILSEKRMRQIASEHRTTRTPANWIERLIAPRSLVSTMLFASRFWS